MQELWAGLSGHQVTATKHVVIYRRRCYFTEDTKLCYFPLVLHSFTILKLPCEYLDTFFNFMSVAQCLSVRSLSFQLFLQTSRYGYDQRAQEGNRASRGARPGG